MRPHRLFQTAFLAFAIFLRESGQGQTTVAIPGNPDDLPCLRKALAVRRDSGNWEPVRQALTAVFRLGNVDRASGALRWVVHLHWQELSVEERIEARRLFVATFPDSTVSRGFEAELRDLVRQGISRPGRIALYRESIVGGKEVLRKGDLSLGRREAIGLAAAEGLEELEPLMEQFPDLVKGDVGMVPIRWADVLRWQFRLRRGAVDLADAVGLHARRLMEMPEAEFGILMRDDPAFRVTAMEIISECRFEDLSSPICLTIAQMHREKRAPAAGSNFEKGGPAQKASPADWERAIEKRGQASGLRIEGRNGEASRLATECNF